MNWISFLEKGNISLKLLLAIAVLAGCLIFLPNNIKVLLSVDLFANKYKEYIGPTFLVSTVLLFLNSVLFINSALRRKFRFSKIERQIKADVRNLTYHEKSVLREFYLLASDTIPLPLQDATIASLMNKHVIYQIGSYGGISYGEPCLNYSLTQTAKKNISPNLIDLPLTNSDENTRYLKENRPEWIRGNSYF